MYTLMVLVDLFTIVGWQTDMENLGFGRSLGLWVADRRPRGCG